MKAMFVFLVDKAKEVPGGVFSFANDKISGKPEIKDYDFKVTYCDH